MRPAITPLVCPGLALRGHFAMLQSSICSNLRDDEQTSLNHSIALIADPPDTRLASLHPGIRIDFSERLVAPAGHPGQPVAVTISPNRMEVRPAGDGALATHLLVDVGGVPFLTHRADQDGIVSSTLQGRGFWEPLESVLLLSVVRPGMTVVDAGANIGYYTVLLSRILGAGGTIIAFEPEPRNFELLAANVVLAQKAVGTVPAILLDNRALSDSLGEAIFSVYRQNLGFHRLEVASDPHAERMRVQTVTLDRVRGFDGAPALVPKRIDLIKADIQGAELKLLQGGLRTIREDRPMLCLEFEPYVAGDATCLELLDWLVAEGYGQFRLFYSNCDNPAEMVRSLSTIRSADDVRAQVREQRVGAYGTLFTTHSGNKRNPR